MKIAAIVGNDLTRDSRVRREARTLAAAGHQVTLHGVLSPHTEPEEEDGQAVIVRTPLPRWAESPGGWRAGVRMARWYERFEPLVRAAVGRDPPQAIHAHDLDTLLPCARAAKRLRIPCVYDDHEASYVDKLPNYVPRDARGLKGLVLRSATRWLQWRGERIERWARRQGLAAVITVSDSLAGRLVERFGPPVPLVLRNCPDFREVERTDALRVKVGAFPTDRILLYHGVVTEGRGVETVIRALPLLGSDHVLVILGWSWRPDLLEAVADEVGAAAQVRTLPAVPEEEMFRYIASADVGIVPTEPTSVSYRFSLPNKLFESLMAGLPVVASNLPEQGALVERTGAGVVYPARANQDPAVLAEAVRSLLEDPERHAACRERALAAARSELNWERESRKLVDLYAGLSTLA